MADGQKAAGRPPKLAKLKLDPGKPKNYLERLTALQLRLQEITIGYAQHGRQTGLRAVIVFEGWDAAGKGGVIRRMMARLDPRDCKVWPIGAPSPEDQAHHYLYRFFRRLPAYGETAIFDRSWYGRVLVERVEGFATQKAWRRSYDEINGFEKTLSQDGVRLVKVFLHISPDEQLRRFRARLDEPIKRWKLTEEDIRNRLKWPLYQQAIQDMLDKTHTAHAPWTVIAGNNKKHARLATMSAVAERLADGVDLSLPEADPKVVAAINEMTRLESSGDI